MNRMLMLAGGTILLVQSTAFGQTDNKPRYWAEVPQSITTPDVVQTERLGTLRCFDGMPDEVTVRKVYDNLDFCRGMPSFLHAIPAASVYAMRQGMKSVGVPRTTSASSRT